ncbi:MAG: lipoprotein precursor [Saprospiraceae bacterium]|nr:MAG: lipoprotein precursor [Saprospiraceae bacterium]
MKFNNFAFLIVFGALLTITSCKDDDEPGVIPFSEAVENYNKIVYASYEDSYNTALELKAAIDAFVANPTEVGYDDCKSKWKAARIPYGQTEAYRFYGGPIDDDDGPEGLINAWPMDESFIDYVQGNVDGGLINDPVTYPVISKQVLLDLNESISETSIFTGYHAIEFLLWGQDFSADGPGSRPYTDFVDGGTAANQDRRREYLVVVTDLLLENLQEVLNEWTPTGAYRTAFSALDYKVSLGKVFTALGELSKGELAGERMFVAVDSKDQEDEHSCFSDNTHIDIQMNYQGIKNVYFGTYTRTDGSLVSGTSLNTLAMLADDTKAKAANDAFVAVDAAMVDLPVPFDQGIVNSEEEILPIIEALRDLSDRLADVGVALEVEF